MSRQLPSFLQIKLSGPLSRLVRQTAPVSIGLLLLPIAAHAQAGGTPFTEAPNRSIGTSMQTSTDRRRPMLEFASVVPCKAPVTH